MEVRSVFRDEQGEWTEERNQIISFQEKTLPNLEGLKSFDGGPDFEFRFDFFNHFICKLCCCCTAT